MSSKYIKTKKIKQTQPDRIYQLMFERYIKESYNGCDEVILHHAMTLPSGVVITSCEIYFGTEIVFVNLHVEVDTEYDSLTISNNDKLKKYIKEYQ